MIDKVVSCELSILEWVTLLNSLNILEYYEPLEGLGLDGIYQCIYSQLEIEKEVKQ